MCCRRKGCHVVAPSGYYDPVAAVGGNVDAAFTQLDTMQTGSPLNDPGSPRAGRWPRRSLSRLWL
jgi:hypothetical protein